MPKDYKVYLKHILDSISLIEKYTKGITFAEFQKDKKTIDAVIRNFEIIGEASKKLPEQIKIKHSDIPWRSLIGLRNVLIHEYFGVDVVAVWGNIKRKIPELKKDIKNILSKEK